MSRILVIEEDEAVRTIAARILRDARHDVASEPSFLAATVNHSGTAFDLVLINGGGVAWRQQLLIAGQVKAIWDAVVVLVSGAVESGIPLTQHSHFSLLRKPFTPAELLEAVSLATARAHVRHGQDAR